MGKPLENGDVKWGLTLLYLICADWNMNGI
jgi:hypothetical protein